MFFRLACARETKKPSRPRLIALCAPWCPPINYSRKRRASCSYLPLFRRRVGAGRDDPDRVEDVDLAVTKAEVADQQMTAKPAETRRCQPNPPRRGEATAGDQFLDEVAVFIEDRHGPCAQRGVDLGGASRGRIDHVNVAADIPHVERDKPSRQRGGDGCAGRKARRGE